MTSREEKFAMDCEGYGSGSESRSERPKYPYADHDQGIVLDQPRPGEFTRTPMTPAQLAARDPALAIAKDIYRHANQAGVCYYEFWLLISKAIQDAMNATASEQQCIPFGWWDHFNGVLYRDLAQANRAEDGGNKITPLYERNGT